MAQIQDAIILGAYMAIQHLSTDKGTEWKHI